MGAALQATVPSRLIFLPGAMGDPAFWRPVGERLAAPAEQLHLGWPGFGPTPADPSVQGLEDLAALVVEEIDRPTALIAQSMGGVVAVLAALQAPRLVTHLVLAATSGGIDLAGLGAADWRPAFERANPRLPRWFSSYRADLGAGIATLEIPALLLWGDRDPISPVAVGRRLERLLPDARLEVIAGGGHDLAHALPERVAPLIDAHLAGRAGIPA
jgi:pimeloyl-ACP methyl ester carboxylesterase